MELYENILIFLAVAGTLCIAIAWKSIWGRFLPAKNSADDPWNVKRAVAGLLATTEIDIPIPVGERTEEQGPTSRRVTVMDPEDAVRLVIQTRRITSISFVALAALIFLCLAVLTGVMSKREKVSEPQTASRESQGQRRSEDPSHAPQTSPDVTPPNNTNSAPHAPGIGDGRQTPPQNPQQTAK